MDGVNNLHPPISPPLSMAKQACQGAYAPENSASHLTCGWHGRCQDTVGEERRNGVCKVHASHVYKSPYLAWGRNGGTLSREIYIQPDGMSSFQGKRMQRQRSLDRIVWPCQ